MSLFPILNERLLNVPRPTFMGWLKTFSAQGAPHTRRAYTQRLTRFRDWIEQVEVDPASDTLVDLLRGYLQYLHDEGLSARTCAQYLRTLKQFFMEVGKIQVLPPDMQHWLESQLALVKAPRVRQEPYGVRLSVDQLNELLARPGVETHRGRRDTALLGVLGICGLRRQEASDLSWRQITTSEGHPVILDIKGKNGSFRTVKLPYQLWQALDDWATLAGLPTGPDAPVFTRILKGDLVVPSDRLSVDAIWYAVSKYTHDLVPGIPSLAPHDLRRTAAAIASRNGAAIEGVQHMLGHAHLTTTSYYLQSELNLDKHPVDYNSAQIPRTNRQAYPEQVAQGARVAWYADRRQQMGEVQAADPYGWLQVATLPEGKSVYLPPESCSVQAGELVKPPPAMTDLEPLEAGDFVTWATERGKHCAGRVKYLLGEQVAVSPLHYEKAATIGRVHCRKVMVNENTDPQKMKILQAELTLHVQANSKFVRGLKRLVEHIRNTILRAYEMEVVYARPSGGTFVLYIPYQTEEELERRVGHLWSAMSMEADMSDQFVEGDIQAMDGSERWW